MNAHDVGKTLIDAYKNQWRRSRSLTKRYALSAPASLYVYKSYSGGWTFRKHLLHALSWESIIWSRFLEPSDKFLEENEEDSSSKASVLQLVDEVTAGTEERMQNLRLDGWAGDYATFSGKRLPFFKMLLQQLEHEAHHRGQLAPYFRQNGLTPRSSNPVFNLAR